MRLGGGGRAGGGLLWRRLLWRGAGRGSALGAPPAPPPRLQARSGGGSGQLSGQPPAPPPQDPFPGAPLPTEAAVRPGLPASASAAASAGPQGRRRRKGQPARRGGGGAGARGGAEEQSRAGRRGPRGGCSPRPGAPGTHRQTRCSHLPVAAAQDGGSTPAPAQRSGEGPPLGRAGLTPQCSHPAGLGPVTLPQKALPYRIPALRKGSRAETPLGSETSSPSPSSSRNGTWHLGDPLGYCPAGLVSDTDPGAGSSCHRAPRLAI